MWQRFTDRARHVVFYSQEEAGRLGYYRVAPEHLLLGLVRENDNMASRILDRMGVSLGRIRSEVERQVTRGDGRMGQDMKLTPAGVQVIELAHTEAHQLSNNYIGTEHLLLALIRDEGLAGRVLAKLGVELERARREVMALQDNDSGKMPGSQPPHTDTFAAEFAKLSVEQQAALTGDGLPLNQLPEAMQQSIRGMCNAAIRGTSYFFPNTSSLISVNVWKGDVATRYEVTTSATFITNFLQKEE